FRSLASSRVAGDTNCVSDVFVHDRCLANGAQVPGCTPSTERVSVASDGTPGNGFSGNPSISADGRFVAFDSIASNLVSGNTNVCPGVFGAPCCPDVFVHDPLPV